MRYLIVLLLFLVGCSEEKRPIAKFNIGDTVIVLRDGYRNCMYGRVIDFKQGKDNTNIISNSWYTIYTLDFESSDNDEVCPKKLVFGEKFLMKRNDVLDYEAEAIKRGFRIETSLPQKTPEITLPPAPTITEPIPTPVFPISRDCQECVLMHLKCSTSLIDQTEEDIRTFGVEPQCEYIFNKCKEKHKCQ